MLKELITALGRRKATITIVVLLAALVYIGFQTFDLGNENRALWNERKATLSRIRLVDTRTIERERLAASLIKSLDLEVAGLRSSIGRKDQEIKRLEAESEGREKLLAEAKTDAERVPILYSLIEDWKARFSISQAQVKDYAGIMFALERKVDEKDALIYAYKGQIAVRDDALAVDSAALTALRASLRRAKFASSIKTGVIVAAAVYIAVECIIPSLVHK